MGENWTVDALAWVRIEERRLLAVRSVGKSAFYLPGGKREAGESDLDALLREVKEELTVSLLPDTVVGVGTYRAPAHDYPAGTSVDLVCYSGDFEGEIKAAAEIEEVAWLGIEDLERCAPAVRLVMEELQERGEL
ncbi:MAG TPA: NUDIX domain-containing protein [Candidatus Dormibacteraeota bacterium]|nr:NUDIX domain-containing protein [Candidatus Dormibacteraeota bacterium]